MSRSWGFTAAALTLATTLSPLANGASRVFWGWASDRLRRENTMIFTFVLQSLCLVAVATLGQISGAWFAATLVAVYFTWGQIYSLFPATAGDYFGTRHATSNYAVLYTAKGVASIIGGWFGALLYEQSGSWSMGFYGSAVMALVAAGLAERAMLQVAYALYTGFVLDDWKGELRLLALGALLFLVGRFVERRYASA